MIGKLPALFGGWKAGLLETTRHRLYAADLPFEPRNDDLYLVEFPKSGVTWLTFLVANTNLLLAGEAHRHVTFFNILDFVPDIHVNRDIGPAPLRAPGFRCIKSHAAYNPYYRKVVYLARDPRNVMASYFEFLTKLGWYHGTLEQMIKDPHMGIRAWRRHTRSWLDSIPPTHSFIVLRYEDLLPDTAGEIQRLYRTLGWNLDAAMAAAAVERSSLVRMREEEKIFNQSHPALSGFTFMRDGQMGGGRCEISEDLTAYIESVAAPEMRRLGYIP